MDARGKLNREPLNRGKLVVLKSGADLAALARLPARAQNQDNDVLQMARPAILIE